MGYNIFNAVAHLAMLLLVLEVLVLLVIPAAGIGLVGVLGLRLARRRLGGPLARGRALPPLLFTFVDRACTAAAWPIIRVTGLWRGARTTVAALRRQSTL